MSEYTPRVSEILSLLYPGNLAFVPQEALDEGQRLHLSMEAWANDWIEGYQFVCKREERVQRAIDFLENLGVEPIAAEQRLVSKMGYTGQIDLRCYLQNERWVIDHKFADAITEGNRLQIEAYFRMAKEHGKVDRAGLLHVSKDGPVRLLKHRPNTKLWHAFLSACNVLRFQQSRRPNIVLEQIEPLDVFPCETITR